MLKLDRSQIHLIREQLFKAYKQTADKGHRNISWFDTLIDDPFNKNKYTTWYVIPDVAFATVQKYNNTQRLLTRFFEFGWFAVHPRSKVVKTPAVEILIEQLKDYNEGFISLEYLKRKKLVKEMANRYKVFTGLDWKVPEGMYQTCEADCAQCWQNITYTGTKPNLKSMSYDEWKQRYES